MNNCKACNREVTIDNLKGKPANAKGYCVGFDTCIQRKANK